MVRTKEQISTYQKRYYVDNRERINARVRVYALENKDRVLAAKKAYRDSHTEESKLWKKENYQHILKSNKDWVEALPYEKQKWYSYRGSAKQRGIKWNLTFEQFSAILLASCHYCGAVGGSVDRKDSLKDYSPNNILPSCRPCNRMKSVFSYDFFIAKCAEINKKHGK